MIVCNYDTHRYRAFSGFKSFAMYYLTVDELKAQGDSIYGQEVRVSGEVLPDSIDWDTDHLTVRFAIGNEGERLPMVYKGVGPDLFKPGIDAVVQGV